MSKRTSSAANYTEPDAKNTRAEYTRALSAGQLMLATPAVRSAKLQTMSIARLTSRTAHRGLVSAAAGEMARRYNPFYPLRELIETHVCIDDIYDRIDLAREVGREYEYITDTVHFEGVLPAPYDEEAVFAVLHAVWPDLPNMPQARRVVESDYSLVFGDLVATLVLIGSDDPRAPAARKHDGSAAKLIGAIPCGSSPSDPVSTLFIQLFIGIVYAPMPVDWLQAMVGTLERQPADVKAAYADWIAEKVCPVVLESGCYDYVDVLYPFISAHSSCLQDAFGRMVAAATNMFSALDDYATGILKMLQPAVVDLAWKTGAGEYLVELICSMVHSADETEAAPARVLVKDILYRVDPDELSDSVREQLESFDQVLERNPLFQEESVYCRAVLLAATSSVSVV